MTILHRATTDPYAAETPESPPCPACAGSGEIRVVEEEWSSRDGGYVLRARAVACPVCRGTGVAANPRADAPR